MSHTTLAVRLTPRAKADAVEGWAEDEAGRPYLKVRVRAQPIEGRANAALKALLAEALGVARSAVSVAKGGQSRLKQVRVEGLDEAELRAIMKFP
ncbi:MAG: DUF167 domain-containing protein [Proteobacteria bacterium]|nr:DUF167 domain-containing protein [Pseudomonadota bacterium]